MSMYMWLYIWLQAPFLSTNLAGCLGAFCVNNADWEGCEFSFLLFCFSFVLPRFTCLSQGQPGQEDGGGVHEDPGYRSVCQKTLLVISLFSFSTSFRSTCLSKLSKDPFHHFSILLPPGSPSTTLADPSWQRWPPESSRIHKDPNWIGPGRLLEWWVVLGLIQSHVFSHPRSFPTPIQKTTILLSSTFSFITEGEEGGMMCNHTTWELISDCFMEMFNLPRNGKVHLIKQPV